MLFMKLISPKALPDKTEWRFRHNLYRFLLKAVSSLYVRGKIDDCIIVNGVEVTHILHDVWFENELQRFGLKLSVSYHVTPIDCLDRRWYHRFSMFKWEEELKVRHNGKDCCIARNKRVNFDTVMTGILLSSSDDILSIRFSESVNKSVATKTVVPTEKPKPKKIHFTETVKPKSMPAVGTVPNKTPKESTYTQHKGFEENEIF